MEMPDAAVVCHHCGQLTKRGADRKMWCQLAVTLGVVALLVFAGMLSSSGAAAPPDFHSKVSVRTLRIAAGEWRGEPRAEVIGEVTNLTTEPLAAIQCQADCRDAAGALVDHYNGQAIGNLPGGATLRFKLSWKPQGPVADYHSAEMRITDLKPASALP